MDKCSLRGRSLLRAALLGATAFALTVEPAMARVGVTSATDGDPLGKPPMENERVLRIGIDVQANEVVRTGATDRAHLVFLDGSSLTVGPNARLTIDTFVFDPNTKKGDLAITATQGVFRLVGGKISKSSAITVTTPSSTIGIRGGITILKVTASETVAAFIFGTSLTVTGAGQTRTVTRPGYQVVVNAGSAPGGPTAIPKGGLTFDLAVLETGSSQSGGSNNADQRAQSSGFSAQNSGQPPGQAVSALIPINPQPQNNNAINNAISTALSNANTEVQVTTTVSSLSNSNSTPVPPPPPPTQSVNGFASGLVTTVNGNAVTTSVPVLGGPTDVKGSFNAATGQVATTIVLRQADSSVTTLQLGGTPSTGVLINEKSYAMVTTDDASRPSTVQVNGSTYNVQNSSFVLSSGYLQQPGSFGSCTCEYLTWGQWGTVITYPNNYRPNQVDIVSLSPYVAGSMTPQVLMPQTGSATYTGSMMGNVSNNGSTPYSATGSYSSTWGFASRAGSFNASFDGTSYSGSAKASAGSGGTSFTGNFSGGGRSGNLSGAFFASPTDAAKYQAGAFTIGTNTTNYKAAGVFAGQR
ncbi:FecR domain-containing protein [Reyranella sp.]|uniref:FecR domain-containing protein n=1 Tax=Reyranella sp. TaxID=1929291 RepID=UPI003D0A2D8A